MPSRETPSYSSSRVQRASRLNGLEQIRLQQKLVLLEKARLHQARLTNQDIRLTSTALEYILSCSGHSPEGRGPAGQQGSVEAAQQEDPCFLYGERVVSRKVRRMPRPHSAVERTSYRRQASQDSQSTSNSSANNNNANAGSSTEDSRRRLPPRPQSSPAKGRSWSWGFREDAAATANNSNNDDNGSGGSDLECERQCHSRGWSTPSTSRPSTAGGGGGGPGWGAVDIGRTTPRQAWEDDTDEVTMRILKSQQQQQQYQQLVQQQQGSRRNNLYMRDLGRMRQQHQQRKPQSSRSFGRQPGGGGGRGDASPSPSPAQRYPASSPTTSHQQQARVQSPPRPPSAPVIEDRKPVSPSEKRARSGGGGSLGRRAGFSEIMNRPRATMSASAWRSHLASTQTAPRSAESQRQLIMDARLEAEKKRQQHVMQKVDSFMGQVAGQSSLY